MSPHSGAQGHGPLYERDPQAWRAHLAEGNRTQARKRVAVQVIIHDTQGRLLLVDPTYKPDWDVPGGMVEANEPPEVAARRELREELGLQVVIRALLCVDWVTPHEPWDDLLVLVFDGGTLPPERSAAVRPTDSELGDAAFCTYTQAEQRLRDYVWRRTYAALNARHATGPTYTHNGVPATAEEAR